MANGYVQNDATKKAIATSTKCLSSFVGFASLPSSIPHASFTEPASLQRSIPRENKNLNLFATFFRLAIPSHASNSGNRPFGGRFSALSRPYPRLKNPQQLPIAKNCNLCRYFVSEPRDIRCAIDRAGSQCRGHPRESAIGQISPSRTFLPVSPVWALRE